MTPEEALELVQKRLKAMERVKTAVVKVGLPEKEDATRKVYKSEGDASAPTVLDVGIWHEYGTKLVPMRSFLRAPFITKKADIQKLIDGQLILVTEKDLDVEVALGRIGLGAKNISVGAFRSNGYGEWPDIKESTKKEKGSSGALIDTGLLRNSITWVVE